MEARVPAVLEVLRGRPTAEVAARFGVEVDALAGWVRTFVESGTAHVMGQPAVDAAEQRNRFLAAFAHEVRAPLSMTLGWVATLADGQLPPDQAHDSLVRLHAALTTLTDRTFDVQLVAELLLGRLALAPHLVAVGQLVGELDGLGVVEGLGGAEEVVVDPTLMRRVLRDVWQAAGAIPAPRGRRLEVRRVHGWMELTVHRDGTPLDAPTLRALEEPFDLNEDGTGVRIGLDLARALTAAHGGSLTVEDAGTVFRVRVPAQPS